MKKAIWLTLLLVGCQSSTIGMPCTADTDCEHGQSCFLTGFPGGQCATGCVELGTSKNCPGDSLCTHLSSDVTVQFCAPPCTDDAACRGGQYSCRPIEGGTKSVCSP